MSEPPQVSAVMESAGTRQGEMPRPVIIIEAERRVQPWPLEAFAFTLADRAPGCSPAARRGEVRLRR